MICPRSFGNAGPLRGRNPNAPTITDGLGGPIATAFGYQRPCLRKGEDYPQALWRNSEATEGQRKRQALAGRAARAETNIVQGSDDLFSPANRPARNSEANPKGQPRATNTLKALAEPTPEYGCAVFCRRPSGRGKRQRGKKTGSRGPSGPLLPVALVGPAFLCFVSAHVKNLT